MLLTGNLLEQTTKQCVIFLTALGPLKANMFWWKPLTILSHSTSTTNTFSMVLLALVDSSYRFIMVDLWPKQRLGHASGQSIWTSFGWRQTSQAPPHPHQPSPAHTNPNPTPPPALPGAPDLGEMLYVFVGAEAFPLKVNLMRPYTRQPGSLPQEKLTSTTTGCLEPGQSERMPTAFLPQDGGYMSAE